jgi:hypothetical protein
MSSALCETVEDSEHHPAMLHHALGPLRLSAECQCPDSRNEPSACCDHAAAVGLDYLTDDLR